MADVIVIGGAEIESDLIRKISLALGTSSGEVIRVLKHICVSPEPLEDVGVVHLPPGHYDVSYRLPDPIYFPCFLDGYSYHPNHGEPCDYLWVDPSIIHDMLIVLAGYFMVLFHRKCFMQLKRFVNLRF